MQVDNSYTKTYCRLQLHFNADGSCDPEQKNLIYNGLLNSN